MFDRNWYQSPGSRGRLEKISNHFLDSVEHSPAVQTEPAETLFLPVLLEDTNQLHAAQYIANAMMTQCDCRLFSLDQVSEKTEEFSYIKCRNIKPVDIKQDEVQSDTGFNIPFKQKNIIESGEVILQRIQKELCDKNDSPFLCLLTLTIKHKMLVSKLDNVVIPVAANLDALRQAYIRIKQLCHDNKPNVSITITHANSSTEARGYFEKIATAALRFLNLDVLYNGYIDKHTLNPERQYQPVQNKLTTEHATRIIVNHNIRLTESSVKNNKRETKSPEQYHVSKTF